MPRKYFDQELKKLNQQMIKMALMISDRIEKTIRVLKTDDRELAQQVVLGDREIDSLEQENEKFCMNLLAMQQPLACDLREIAACLKILTDMEREADQCADICEILETGTLDPNSLLINNVVQMMGMAQSMFQRAMNVFLSGDIEEAKAVCKEDDEVDAAFGKLVLEICASISKNPEQVMKEVDLLFIIKYIERMGDHATNIAEWVIYRGTGEHPDLNGEEELPDEK